MILTDINRSVKSSKVIVLALSPFGQTHYSFFIKSAGGGIDMVVSGAFPQNHGIDFETSC